jgi:drug/metabolite transporter (DMT)-like permease
MSTLCTQQFFVVAILMMIVLYCTKESYGVPDAIVPSLLWQMIIFTIVPYALIQWASKYSNEMTVAMYDGVVEPLTGGIVAWGLFKNPVTQLNVVGAFIMVIAFAWSILIEHRRPTLLGSKKIQ